MRVMSSISNAFGCVFIDYDASSITRRAPSPACGGGLGWGLYTEIIPVEHTVLLAATESLARQPSWFETP
jgi:hypothetical protein